MPEGCSPFAAGYYRDPYPVFRRLRESEPVYWSDRLRRWVVTRYEDAAAILRDPETFSSRVIPAIPTAERIAGIEAFELLSHRWLFFLDPPGHTPERSAVARLLAPRAVSALAPAIRSIAEELLERAAGQPEFDLVSAFAHPLAAAVILRLLGAPGEAQEALLADCRAMEAASVDARNPVRRRQGFEAIVSATRIVERLIDDEACPSSGFAASLADAVRKGDLDLDAARSHSLSLLFAGIETVQNLIGNAVHCLLRHPEQADLLRRRPDLIETAVEECLRYEVPVLGVLRRAETEVTLAGRRIAAAEEIVVMLGAGNRDPAVFTDPDRFDTARSPVPHLAFGLGIHYCPGAALARLTARTALAGLLPRLSQRSLTPGDPDWRDHDPIVRGLRRLPLKAWGKRGSGS